MVGARPTNSSVGWCASFRRNVGSSAGAAQSSCYYYCIPGGIYSLSIEDAGPPHRILRVVHVTRGRLAVALLCVVNLVAFVLVVADGIPPGPAVPGHYFLKLPLASAVHDPEKSREYQ